MEILQGQCFAIYCLWSSMFYIHTKSQRVEPKPSKLYILKVRNIRSYVYGIIQFSLELNTDGVEAFLGYFHSIDTYQHAFLHKSSITRVNIPYNNSVWPATAVPNYYTFHVKSNVVHDFEDQACTLSTITESDVEECYINHLESNLNCTLNWENDISGSLF